MGDRGSHCWRMTAQNPDNPSTRRARTWIERLGDVVMVVAGGIFVNVLSEYTGARGVAVGFAAAGVRPSIAAGRVGVARLP